MSRLMIVLLLASLLTACLPMSDERATRALEAAGMTNISLGGMAIFGCGEKDTFRKSFTATSANGQRVEGVVCGGLLKGATVRID